MKIKYKLLFLVLGLITLVYLLVFGFIIYTNYKYSKKLSVQYTDAVAALNAEKLIKDVDEDFAIARTLAQGFMKYTGTIKAQDLNVYKNVLRNVLEKNQRYSGVSLSLELAALSKNYNKDYGRLRISYFNEGGVAKLQVDTLDIHGDNVSSPYYDLKINPQEEISEPYLFSPYNNNTYRNLISSVSVPLVKDEKFIGLLQFDILLNHYKKMIYNVKPFVSTEAFLVSNNGSFVASSDRDLQNKTFTDINKDVTFNILQKVKDGSQFSYFQRDSIDQLQYYSYYPLKFGNSEKYWSLGISIPYKNMLKDTDYNLKYSIMALIIGFLVMASITWFVARDISVPLSKAATTIRRLASGEISSDVKISVANSDELGMINRLLNKLIDTLENNINFALEIGQGNLSYDFKPIGDKDVLGNALLGMRKSLRQAEVEEKLRKADDQKMNWSTQGFAKFGELMRENTGNLVEFSYSIISNLVKYLDANQGGLFLINNTDKSNVFVELLASYAYNRRKYIEKKIPVGVGLVGRCMEEQETIYMTDFPSNYLNISSGLGESSPKSLLIVPIIFNNQMFGVIEIASLHDMKKYQIEFIERIGESIGSTISNVKINEKTAVLLEESNLQSEKLIAEDRELRKQLEAILEVKDNLDKQLMDANAILNSLNDILLVAEFNMQGRLVNINKNFLNFIGKSKHEVVGMFQGSFAVTKDDPRNLFRDFWNELRKGITKTSYQNVKINNKEYHFYESYMPIMDENGKPYKVLNFAVDLTPIHKIQQDNENN